MKRRPVRHLWFLLFWLFVLPVLFPASTHADILRRNAATGQNAVWHMDGVTMTSAAWKKVG